MPIINGQGRIGVRVTGGSPAPSSSYLLDTYGGAAAAYSLRKLSNTYSGSAIRVRRSYDNTEQNIGFDGSGNLDTTALTTFVGAGNGFVVTWYDQSGNGYNLTQTTAASQPKIVNSGTVLLSNSKPIIQTDGNSFLYNATIPINGTTNSIFFGLKITSSKSTCAMMSGGGDVNQHFPMRTGTGADRFYDSVSNITAAALPTGLNLINLHENSAGITVYENNTLLTSNYTHNTSNSTGLYLFRRESGNGLPADYGINEVIIYGSISKLSDNSAISTNINNYYSIYTPLDSDASSFISAASITDSTQISAVNTLVTSLKSAGLWTKMKAIYPFVGGTASAHKFNLKDPRDLDAAYRLVFNGGWTHSSTGALPNGSNGYADTKLVPSGNITTQNNHLSYYSRTNVNGGFDMGAQSAGAVELLLITRYVNGNAYYGSNDTSYGCNTANSTAGFIVGTTNSSATQTLYKNGSSIKTSNTAGTQVPTTNLFIGAHNNGGATNFGNKEAAFVSIGDGLSSSESSAFYTAVQAFQTTLGRQV